GRIVEVVLQRNWTAKRMTDMDRPFHIEGVQDGMEIRGVNVCIIGLRLGFAGQPAAAQVMHDTTVLSAEDTRLQKELLPEAHIAMGEDQREACALDFVVEFRSIRCRDERHDMGVAPILSMLSCGNADGLAERT